MIHIVTYKVSNSIDEDKELIQLQSEEDLCTALRNNSGVLRVVVETAAEPSGFVDLPARVRLHTAVFDANKAMVGMRETAAYHEARVQKAIDDTYL